MLKGELVETITSDGLELKGFFIDKKSDIAVFHNHGTSGDFYTHKFIQLEGELLSKEGVSFLSANNRGHDVYADIRKHTDSGTVWASGGGGFERFEDCIIDISSWIDFLTKRGVKKIILQAHSLTQKILYYQWLKKDKKIVGQIHISPCNDAGLVRMRLGEKEYSKVNSKIKELIKSGHGNDLLNKKLYVVCPMSAIAYSGYLTEKGAGNLFPYHNPNSGKWEALNSIKEPLLAVFGEDDIYINNSCPEKNTEFVANLFKSKAVNSKKTTTVIVPKANHSYIDSEPYLMKAILKWLKENFKI